MVTAGLIHPFLVMADNLFVWIGGRMGVPFWVVIGISFLVFYFYWNQIFGFTKMILRKVIK